MLLSFENPIVILHPFADQCGFAKTGGGRDEGHAWRAARRQSLVQPLDQASTEDYFRRRWGI